MSNITAKMVKELRDRTGAGMMECKKALIESEGNMDNAIEAMRKAGQARADKKSTRIAAEGVINLSTKDKNIANIVEINCETDFVAKTEGFNELAQNLSMQIAATNPASISRDDMDPAVLEREKTIFTDQAKESGKPDNIVEKMVEGRIEKFFAESCLLEQQYIKDSDRKVSDLLTEAVSTLGENIVVIRFVRFAIGE